MQGNNIQQWEYHIEYSDWNFTLFTPQQTFNVNMRLQKLGVEGWELATAVPREMKDGVTTGVAYILKRPKK